MVPIRKKLPRLDKELTLKERFGALTYVFRLFKEVWTTSPPLPLVSLGLRLFNAFQPVVTFYIGKMIVDEVVSLSHLHAPTIGFKDWVIDGQLDKLATLICIELGLTLCFDASNRVIQLTDGALSEKHNNRMSIALMVHAASLDLEHFEDSSHQDELERARGQAVWSSNLLSQVFGQCESLITLITLLVALFTYAPILILLLALASIPAVWNEARFNTISYRLNYGRAEDRRRLDYLRQIGISADTAKEIKLFSLSGFLIERFAGLSDKFYVENRRLALSRGLWSLLFFAISTSAYYFAYGVIIWRTVIGTFSLGDLAFLTSSFQRLRGLIQSLLFSTTWISARALDLRDLFSFFNISPKIISPKEPLPFPQTVQTGFEFKDVGFRYPGSDQWILRHLSFTLRPSEVIALVGENGAGKTTVVKLLTRLYDPNEGQILLEGIDLKLFSLEELRSRIGVIFQDFVRFDMTAHENIAIGRIDWLDDSQKVSAAAERSLASSIIELFPMRYAQPLGKRFREGRELSGGEWQKIALARAYMREAECLILDEPTAAIDARAEAEVFERFKELSRGRSAVLISHRFSTVRIADRILVLENGSILEEGSHEALLKRQGRYAELFELQARGYR